MVVLCSAFRQDLILICSLSQDLQESKLELAAKIRDLESAKEAIRALKMQPTLEQLEVYLRNHCPLRPDNRKALGLSAGKDEDCNKVSHSFSVPS